MNDNKTWQDPIVDEVRENREKLFKESGSDLDEYAKRIKQEEIYLAEKGVKYVTLSPTKIDKKEAA